MANQSCALEPPTCDDAGCAVGRDGKTESGTSRTEGDVTRKVDEDNPTKGRKHSRNAEKNRRTLAGAPTQ